MGKQIAARSPERQKIYTQVVDRLLAGESAVELEAETGVPAATLRAWKRQRLRAQAREAVQAQDALAVYNQAKTNGEDVALLGVVDADSGRENALKLRNDQLGDGIKTLLLEQAVTVGPLLEAMRAKIGCGLYDSHDSITSALSQTKTLIISGVTTTDEHGNETREPLSLAQLKLATATLKELTKLYADLHLLPHGALKSAALRFGDSVPPQHIHLHSHGGRDTNPGGIDLWRKPKTEDTEDVKGVKGQNNEEVIDVESTPIDPELQGEQTDLLSKM